MTPGEISAYTCETEVLDVHLKAHYGPTIKLRFADKEQAARFRKGQRLYIACVEVGDDEEMVPETRERPIQRRPYRLSQLAGMICVEPWFWRFAADKYGEQIENKDDAAAWLRNACGVISRSQLDGDKVAGETFRRLLAEYDQWRAVP